MQLDAAQLFGIAITILGAGLSAFIGVRVALAEMRQTIASINKDLIEINTRLNRLENPFFDKRHQ